MNKTFSDGGKLRITRDENTQSPREWDNLGRMICFHNRYNIGDKHDYKESEFVSWDGLHQRIMDDNNVSVILPIRMYEHSGIALSTGSEYPFNDAWDSGMVGFIFATFEDIIRDYGDKVIR